MSTYKLDLAIDSQSLSIIKASGLNIILAKPVSGQALPNVAWLTFDPFGGNSVEWTEEFGIYASPQQILKNGAVISRISEQYPASDASYYSFNANSTFSGPFIDAGAPGQGEYQVNNNMPSNQYPALTFGLQQKASITTKGVDICSPLNAQLVPSNMEAVFTPLTTVYVWLEAKVVTGSVITKVVSKATIVTFGGTTKGKSLSFDKNTGRFIPCTNDGKQLIENDPEVNFYRNSGIY